MSVNAASGHWKSSRLAIGSTSCDYHIWVPSRCESQMPTALLLFLHGCRQKFDNLTLISGMNEVAGEHGSLVVYPQQRRRANFMRCWNWFEPQQQIRTGAEPSILASIAREVTARFQVNPRRVYVGGISAGGAMAVTLAVTYPDVFAALGVVAAVQYGAAHGAASGWKMMHHGGPDPLRQGALAFQAMQSGLALRPRSRLPVIAFYGNRDSYVAPPNADQLIAQWTATNALLAQAAGRDGLLSSVTTQGEVPNGRTYTVTAYSDGWGPLIEDWRIHGMGHAWPGAPVRDHYADPLSPNGAREMWRFFSESTRKDE
jgi:poly(hydroxyalkanoate) depolymerase family esterase